MSEALREARLFYEHEAGKLGDYKKISETHLANMYCEAEADHNEALMSQAFAALMIHYWGKINKWIFDSASLKLEDTEFVDWLAQSLYIAFYYREWRDEYRTTYKEGKLLGPKHDEEGNLIPNEYWFMKDPTAVDKIINRCCYSMRGRMYQFYNHDKRKSKVLADSLDSMTEDVDDAALAFTGCTYEDKIYGGARCLIEEFIKKERHLEAFILDEIIYDESSTTRKVDGEKQEMFDERKVIRNLAEADIDLVVSFCNKYRAGKPEKILAELKEYSNPKLYIKLRKTLSEIRNNPKLLNLLYE